MINLQNIKEIAMIIVILAYAIHLVLNAIANYILAINSKKPPKSRQRNGGFKK